MFEESSIMQQRYSVCFRSFASRLHDILFYFLDVTNKADLHCMTDNSSCIFRNYEELRLAWLGKQVYLARTNFTEEKTRGLSTSEENPIRMLKGTITSLLSKIDNTLKDFKRNENSQLLIVGYSLIRKDCEFLMRKISQLNLTKVFPIIKKKLMLAWCWGE